MKTGSAYLVGNCKLGIPPLPKDAKTHPGESPLPCLIIPQMDYISTEFLDEIQLSLFGPDGEFDQLLVQLQPVSLHILYVAFGVVAEGSILVLEDSLRQGKQNGKEVSSVSIYLASS